MSKNYPETLGRVPLADQITEMLVREIKTGILPDGERLPPERSMAERLNISVGTLRKALAELENRGLLTRVQGSGNYVNNSLDEANVYALFRLELTTGPAAPSARLLSVERLAKPAQLPPIGDTAHAFRFRRIRILDTTEAALEEIWLDGRYADQIEAHTVPDSLYRFYRDDLKFRITRVEDRVSVAPLPDWAPDSWREHNPVSWGFIERLARDQDGQPAEFSRTWFQPEQVRFVSR
ncbi:GntR family transcriptional regulator [Granulosicoccus antarcticus]|uniref:HTH-type transcriptional repressor YvoA n=1 Tax=Granulosicoccus antarcticus IMCC3135 TaxID=1192854 RepID=A0A2Z2NXW5_9GAMM|nr:GntR family transcriptional regulator [Granulosicoccus antarcticus]ASJ72597.1 HTH-type transcriptional repressor YvoA [Granulosicoccus antarcticus IMCC3135]